LVFPGSSIFSLPNEVEKDISGFTFFDASGNFVKAVVMEKGSPEELETILQTYLLFKQKAEDFFKGRGSRIFRAEIETHLVLFAKSFRPELLRHLHFYEVKASCISFAFIEGGGGRGILLRLEASVDLKEEVGQGQSSGIETCVGRNRRSFEQVSLTSEERKALEKLRPLVREPGSTELPPYFQTKGEARAQ
jgi:hypothetical protein